MTEDMIAISGGIATGIIFILAVLAPLARALVRRVDAKVGATPPSPELMARLERMEQAIDSIGVEVERISEGQRFTTKLLSEQRGAEGGRALPKREEGA